MSQQGAKIKESAEHLMKGLNGLTSSLDTMLNDLKTKTLTPEQRQELEKQMTDAKINEAVAEAKRKIEELNKFKR